MMEMEHAEIGFRVSTAVEEAFAAADAVRPVGPRESRP